jgi:hypothetical protein
MFRPPAEGAIEPKRHVRGNAPVAMNQIVQRLPGHAEPARGIGDGEPQGLEAVVLHGEAQDAGDRSSPRSSSCQW